MLSTRTVDDRIRWCEQNLRMTDGSPWSIASRPWVRDKLFLPSYGWTISSRSSSSPPKLCDRCGRVAGRVVAWSPELEDKLDAGCSSCAGLKLTPIQSIVQYLPRREGKTTNLLSLCVEEMFSEQNRRTVYMAGSKDQSEVIGLENIRAYLRDNEDLADEWTIVGNEFRVPENNNVLEIVPAAQTSRGRGATRVVFEEAKDVPATAVAALLPSIMDNNGQTCVRGHAWPLTPRRRECPVCSARVRPWFGQVLIVGTGGLDESNEDLAWFKQLVEQLEREPNPAAFIYASRVSLNPKVAGESRQMIDSVFAKVPSLSAAVSAELGNEFRQKGDAFLGQREWRRTVDPDLELGLGSDRPAIAFLDTSLSQDVTSLVVMLDDDGTHPWWRRDKAATQPWELMSVAAIEVFDPKLMGGTIDVESVYDACARVLPLYPGLREFWVDTRLMPWARAFVDRIIKERSAWGRLAKRYAHGGKENEVRNRAWVVYEQRILNVTIRHPKLDRLEQEILGLRRHVGANGFEVRDRNRKRRHADIAEAIASLAGRAWELRTQPQSASVSRINNSAEARISALVAKRGTTTDRTF